MKNYAIKVYNEKYGANNGAPDITLFVPSVHNLQINWRALQRSLLCELPENCDLRITMDDGIGEPQMRSDLSDSENIAVWLLEGQDCLNIDTEIDCDETGCRYAMFMVTVEIDDE